MINLVRQARLTAEKLITTWKIPTHYDEASYRERKDNSYSFFLSELESYFHKIAFT